MHAITDDDLRKINLDETLSASSAVFKANGR